MGGGGGGGGEYLDLETSEKGNYSKNLALRVFSKRRVKFEAIYFFKCNMIMSYIPMPNMPKLRFRMV